MIISLAACITLAASSQAVEETLRPDEPLVVDLDGDGPALEDLCASLARSPSAAPAGARAVGFELSSEIDGVLHLWACAAEGPPPVLRVEDDEGRVREDEELTATCATVTVPAREGQLVSVFVARRDPSATGKIELHLALSPETPATRAAAESALRTVAQAEAQLRGNPTPEAFELLRGAAEELDAVEGEEASLAVATAWGDLGYIAMQARLLDFSLDAARHALAHARRTTPPGHSRWVAEMTNVGAILHWKEDYLAARELKLAVLRELERSRPPDDLELSFARDNLAVTLRRLGDLHGARALQEQALDVLSRTRPPDDPDLALARSNLANTLEELGDVDGAIELAEAALHGFEASLPRGHPRMLPVVSGLASLLSEQGRMEEALPYLEEAWESGQRYAPDDWLGQATNGCNLGMGLWTLGQREEGVDLVRAANETSVELLGPSNARTLFTRSTLAWMLATMGHAEEAHEEALLLARGARARAVELSLELGPSEVESAVSRDSRSTYTVLSVAELLGDAELEREALALIETQRSIGVRVARALAGPAAGHDDLRAAVLSASEALAEAGATAADGARLERARRTLDGALQAWTRALAADPGTAPGSEAPDLVAASAALPDDVALIGYWVWQRVDFRLGRSELEAPRYLAHVVRKGRPLVRIDLGPIDAVDAAVAAWRDALLAAEAPSATRFTQRGLGAVVEAADMSAEERARGEALRALAIDPLLPSLEGATRWVLALDGTLASIPIDALPVGDALPDREGVLGDARAIEIRTSLGEYVRAEPPRREAEELFALGGIEFGTAPPAVPGDSETAGLASLLGGFAPLPSTREEVAAIAELFARSGREADLAHVLGGAEATRAALVAAAPRAGWLHLATHGWFAPESVVSTLDTAPVDAQLGVVSAMSAREHVAGTSPMLLCGLALSGAARAPDVEGRVEGRITAEELTALDLSGCRLAVLSACETNVGVIRSGQGLASLQKALSMAGARRVLTSLWKVPDRPTRDLMVEFYTNLWIEKLPTHEALWRAKVTLRLRGDPPRNWAGWVLIGES